MVLLWGEAARSVAELEISTQESDGHMREHGDSAIKPINNINLISISFFLKDLRGKNHGFTFWFHCTPLSDSVAARMGANK